MTTQPAWVLSRKNYGDNGLLVEFFTLELGRCGAIVRGAHRRKRGGSLAALLQPFCPLLIVLAGRGDLKTLRMAEAPAAGYPLKGELLMSGLYMNELLAKKEEDERRNAQKDGKENKMANKERSTITQTHIRAFFGIADNGQ